MTVKNLIRGVCTPVALLFPILPITAGTLDFENFAFGEISGQFGWVAGPLSANEDGVDAFSIVNAGVDGSNGLRIMRDSDEDNFASIFWTPDADFLGSMLINADGGQRYAYSFDIDLVNPDIGSPGGNFTSIRIYLGGAVQTANNNASGYAAISISNTGYLSRYGEGPGTDGLSLSEFNTISGVIDFASLTQTVFVNGFEYTSEEPFELGVAGGVVDANPEATFGSIAILMRLQDLEFVIDNFSVSQIPAEPTWAGYPVLDDYVDTGDWLGWIYVLPPYIYIVDLGSWAYMEEAHVNEQGSWAYVFR